MILESASLTLIGFIALIGFLLLFIAKFKWHVFFAMLLPLVAFALIPGVNLNNFIDAFESGFGKTLSGIAIVIVLGSIMAEALKHTGAIEVITKSMVKLVGKKRMPLALTLSGFILGVAVFSDIAFVILNPLVHSAAAVMGVSMSSMSTGLVVALQLTHAVVPPTPGPLAAAAIVGADIGKVIIFGALVTLVGALGGWIWGQFIVGPKIDAPPSEEYIGKSFIDGNIDAEDDSQPTTLKSYLPIIVPVLLIALQSIFKFTLPEENFLNSIFGFLGWPVVALGIGVLLSYSNITKDEHKEAAKNDWVEEGLRTSAMILVVTGLGGSLSQVLRGTPAVTAVTDFVASAGLPAILLPFIIGVLGNTITGSTTVGAITSASLLAPMLPSLGLSPEVAVLAGGSGA